MKATKRLVSMLLAVILVFTLLATTVAGDLEFDSRKRTATIGHAVEDHDKKPGETSSKGEEVMKCTKPDCWDYVYRPKSAAVAEKIASTMDAACANPHIGYKNPVNGDNLSLYRAAKKTNWNVSESVLKTDCECDCATLVAVCVNAAGITLNIENANGSSNFNCLAVKDRLMATKAFDEIVLCHHDVSMELRRGDILLRLSERGHTAVVLTTASGSSTLAINAAQTSYTPIKYDNCPLKGTITSNFDLLSVTAVLDSSTELISKTSFSDPKSFDLSEIVLSTDSLTDSHTITIKATDASQKVVSKKVRVSILQPASTLMISGTSTYTINKGETINISGTIISNYRLLKVTGSLDGSTYKTLTEFGEQKFCYLRTSLNSFPRSMLTTGKHRLVIKATDYSGKTVTKTIYIIVKAPIVNCP